jgi:HTH-type transcriptional regulator/antitoxin HigA
MKAAINEQKYGQLLAKALPRVISSDRQYKKMSAELRELAMRRAMRVASPEEVELFHLVFDLVERYESVRFAKEFNTKDPVGVLELMMDQHDHTAKDLWEVIGDKGTTSKILSGKRKISKAQAKRIAAFYNLSVDLFI